MVERMVSPYPRIWNNQRDLVQDLACTLIMAAGAFVQGSSIELSADGPVKPPYAVYFQGGLTWYHAKLGILKSLQSVIDAGVLSIERVRELL